MRFQFHYLDYKEESTKNKSLTLLEIFLNFHLLERFHGWSYECLIITFRNNAPENKKDAARKSPGQYAKVEINGVFEDNRRYNLHDVSEGFRLTKDAVKMVGQLPLEKVDFDAQKLVSDLEELQSEFLQTEEGLLAVSANRRAMENALDLKRVNGYLQLSKEHPRPLIKRLIGIRVYEHFDGGALMPYVYMYSQIFSTLLHNKRILTPHYQEIYFGIARTMEEAKKKSPLVINDWHKYTYAALDIDAYNGSSEEEKNKMVFHSLCEGLRLIADVDHLDKEKVEKVISQIDREGVDIIMTYKTEENELYKVEIIYRVLADHTKRVPFYLLLTDKATGKSNTVFINNFDTWLAPYSFGKIMIKKKEIIIKGKGGLRGEVSRAADHLPDGHTFIINDILELKEKGETNVI